MESLLHGVDIIETSTIKRLINDDKSDFAERCFTEKEREYLDSPERLAGWFAAKEAVLKALGTGWSQGIGWKDIEIAHDAQGRPLVQLHSKALEIACALHVHAWCLSISHSTSYAIASVIALQAPTSRS